MRSSRGVSWFTVLCALCTLQCAELKPFGDYCGNGAVDPEDEECDGKSFIDEGASSRGKLTCGEPKTPRACHIVCGPNSSGLPCPSENWACRRGVCVALDPTALEALGTSTEVVGPAAAAHVADFDGDGADEIVSIPVSPGAPLVAYFSPLDATRSKAVTLFPAPASRIVEAPRGERARLLTVDEDGRRFTVVHTGLGDQRREFESEPFPIGQIQGAGVDFLLGRTGDSPLLWVHGANGDPDSLVRFSAITRTAKPLLSRPATDAPEHRVVLGIPPDKEAPCGHIAVFTGDPLDPLAAELEVLTPWAGDPGCEWEVGVQSQIFAAKYPAARGPNAVFAADLRSDGVYDLVLNARTAVSGNGYASRSYVLHDMKGQFVPLITHTASVGLIPEYPLAIGAGKVQGYTHPALLLCKQARAGVGLCDHVSATGSLPELSLAFPNQDATQYSGRLDLRSGSVLAAGFGDLNGDGRDDIWAWFANDRGVRIFEARPTTGFSPPRTIDHRATVLGGIVSGSLSGASSVDLLAITEESNAGAGPSVRAGITSSVLSTSGRPDLSAMAPKVIARLSGHVTPAFVPESTTSPGSVLLTSCVSEQCNDDHKSRGSAKFNLALVRAISSDWLATPLTFECSSAHAGVHINDDPYKRAMSMGALQLSNATGGEETQVVTVQNPTTYLDPLAPGLGSFRASGLARWARLNEKAPLASDCAVSQSAIDITAPVAFRETRNEWIEVAPVFTGDPNAWITLVTGTSVGSSDEVSGRAYMLYPGQAGIAMTGLPEGAGDHQAISAFPVDLDNDGDTDFVVLTRSGGLKGRESQRGDRRVGFYINVECNGPSGRCLIVKHLDGFESVSGDALAWAQSPPEADYDASDAGAKPAGTAKVWWLGAVVGDTHWGSGRVKTARVRVEGKDDKMTVAVVAKSESSSDVPAADVSYQHVAWGDFDGDTALDLLYVSDRGSRIYKRATRTR